jgi:hypothetical protein
VRLLNLQTVSGVDSPADHEPLSNEADLQSAGIDSLTVTGVGTVGQTVTIPQALYGRPISQLIVRLRGAATPGSARPSKGGVKRHLERRLGPRHRP